MIRSFRDKRTEAVARAEAPKGFPADILKRALNKLTILEYATDLDDLRSPPGNRLEKLSAALDTHKRPMADLLRLDRSRTRTD